MPSAFHINLCFCQQVQNRFQPSLTLNYIFYGEYFAVSTIVFEILEKNVLFVLLGCGLSFKFLDFTFGKSFSSAVLNCYRSSHQAY